MPAQTVFETDPDEHPLLQASSIAVAIIKKARLEKWEDLNGQLPTDVELTPEQFEMIRKYERELLWIRANGATAIHCVCQVCGAWTLTTGTANTKCITFGCDGRPVKAKTAKRKK